MAVGDDAAVFDAERLAARVGGRPDLLNKLIDLFLAQAPSLLSQIRAGLAARDAGAAARAAHTLKGSAGEFSAAAAAAAARSVEDAGRRGDLAAAAAAADGLDTAMARLVEELRRHRGLP